MNRDLRCLRGAAGCARPKWAVGGIARTTEAHRSGSRVFDASQRARSERVFLLSVEVEGGSESSPE